MTTLVFRKIFRLIALCAILSISLASCSVEISYAADKRVKLKNLGEVETRPLELDENFRGIKVSGTFDVVYVPGDDYAVEIKTHTELINLLKYNIEDGVLNIGLKSFKTNKNIKTLVLTVQAPKLEDISMSGACDFTAKEGIRAEAMSIKASGASDIYIKGVDVDRMGLDISGAAKITIEDLNLNYFNMSSSGASNVKLAGCANESEIEVSGASTIDIKEFESPVLNIETSGLSKVKR